MTPDDTARQAKCGVCQSDSTFFKDSSAEDGYGWRQSLFSNGTVFSRMRHLVVMPCGCFWSVLGAGQ